MPGPQVKNWPLYEKLRAEGHSKESAARIANSKPMPKRPGNKPTPKK